MQILTIAANPYARVVPDSKICPIVNEGLRLIPAPPNYKRISFIQRSFLAVAGLSILAIGLGSVLTHSALTRTSEWEIWVLWIISVVLVLSIIRTSATEGLYHSILNINFFSGELMELLWFAELVVRRMAKRDTSLVNFYDMRYWRWAPRDLRKLLGKVDSLRGRGRLLNESGGNSARSANRV
jgi:cytochrome c biogenesis protein CcdA